MPLSRIFFPAFFCMPSFLWFILVFTPSFTSPIFHTKIVHFWWIMVRAFAFAFGVVAWYISFVSQLRELDDPWFITRVEYP